uniref:ZP domain-containing protein n=1 Tax=Panagrellus redivivus TaxID=6233 RepID=A0A7E4V3P3_PANRE
MTGTGKLFLFECKFHRAKQVLLRAAVIYELVQFSSEPAVYNSIQIHDNRAGRITMNFCGVNPPRSTTPQCFVSVPRAGSKRLLTNGRFVCPTTPLAMKPSPSEVIKTGGFFSLFSGAIESKRKPALSLKASSMGSIFHVQCASSCATTTKEKAKSPDLPLMSHCLQGFLSIFRRPIITYTATYISH